MKEYYISEGELEDLKHAVSTDNKLLLQQLLQEIENRKYRLRMAQAEMIVDYRYFNNSGEDPR